MPRAWAEDKARRLKAGVPEDIEFATKPQIALQQIQSLLRQGAPHHCVLTDAGYGIDYAFRQSLSDLGLRYMVGVTSAVVVWPPGLEPLPPKPYSGMGRPPVMPRRTAKRQPMNVKTLAQNLPDSAFHNISWREGTNEPLAGRFAALRVRCAGRNVGKARLLPEQWLLIEWPADRAEQAEPEKYYLSTVPETTALNDLVGAAHMRRRIERDYQDLKQELGLGHYEGRGWRRFHHRASLSIAAYGFLMAQQLRHPQGVGKKTSLAARNLPYPRITSLAVAQRTQRHVPSSLTTLRLRIAAALLKTLPRCPCCLRVNARVRY